VSFKNIVTKVCNEQGMKPEDFYKAYPDLKALAEASG